MNNHRSELDINFFCSEKKSKNTKIRFSKELTGSIPAILACAGPSTDEQTIKDLQDYIFNLQKKLERKEESISRLDYKNKKLN